MVRAASHKISRVPWYSRTVREPPPFAYRAVTFFGFPFQETSARVWFVTPRPISGSARSVLQHLVSIGPETTELTGFRLLPFRSPLLRESFLFLGVLRCFTSPAYLHPAYVFSWRCPGFTRAGCPIREPPAGLAWQLTGAYRSRATPFFGP